MSDRQLDSMTKSKYLLTAMARMALIACQMGIKRQKMGNYTVVPTGRGAVCH